MQMFASISFLGGSSKQERSLLYVHFYFTVGCES